MEFIKSFLNNLEELPEEQWQEVSKHFRRKSFKKGETFISYGETPSHFAFIEEGIFKLSYLVEKDDREVVKLFSGPKDLIGAYADYLRELPSRVRIMALTNATIYLFDFSDLERLLKSDVFWERFRRKIAEYHYLLKEEKEYELLVHSAETRYQNFLKKFQNLAGEIPDYLIAEYLNITPSYMSTLKKRLGTKN